MDFHHQKTNLSFSIENILREDFSQRRTRNVPSIPSNPSSFERWPSTPVYRYCAVRYCPVFMHFVPIVQRVGARFHRVNAEKQLEFSDQPKNFKEDYLSCEDSEPPRGDDETKDEKAEVETKSEKCLKVNTLKRKRRNRSHFTQRQLQYLDKIFSRQQYLTRDERTLLARGLEMTELQIRNWFQNRRYQKKHCANKNTNPDKPDSVAFSKD
ncbi:hypothetical protein ACROYT_G029752 [Oculina patagonica]